MARKKRRKTHNHGASKGKDGGGNKAGSNGDGDDEDLDKLVNDINNTTATSSSNVSSSSSKNSSTKGLTPISNIHGMRLEAIFHPKFENENRNKLDIRSRMKDKVGDGKGYLEVSLKHSGSLVLWSGYDRYYSKNSTSNHFTSTAEILLRQHFYRCAYGINQVSRDGATTENATTTDAFAEKLYDDCSNYVVKNRLTLAFEVVTSVLGDHGDTPNNDFVMLTAIASRKASHERFYTTTEVLQFCHEYKLPHNDYWVYTTVGSCNKLFELYDQPNIRENGYATQTIKALTHISQSHVESIYPHSVFQGEILEGFIIRYVSYPNGKNSDENTNSSANPKDDTCSLMKQLATQSKSMLEQVPPTLPPSFVLIAKKKDDNTNASPSSLSLLPVWTHDIRKVYHETTNYNSKSSQQNQDSFATALAKILHDSDDSDFIRSSSSRGGESHEAATSSTHPKRPRRKVAKVSVTNSNKGLWDLPSLTQHLCQNNTIGPLSSTSKETMRIANLISSLKKLRKAVHYSLFYEQQQSGPESGDGDNGCSNGGRWICVIHVLHDTTFQKYAKQMKVGVDMPLFRGFSIELSEKPFLQEGDGEDGGDEEHNEQQEHHLDDDDSMEVDKDHATQEDGGEESLMLKMKLLPYMVRTFICRNNLRLLRQDGPSSFSLAAASLFDRWGISDQGKQKWMPFFAEWATYASNCFNGVKNSNGNGGGKEEGGGLTPAEANLPPLTESSYLKHLEYFTKLYESGVRMKSSSTVVPTASGSGGEDGFDFKGMVIVVAVEGDMAQSTAKFLAGRLGGAYVLPVMDALNQHKVSGVVAFATIKDFGQGLRKGLDSVKSYSSLLMIGCNEIDEIMPKSTEQRELKKLKGVAKAFRKAPCGELIELSRSSLSLNEDGRAFREEPGVSISAELKDAIDKMQKLSEAAPEPSSTESKEISQDPGLVVFFPGIPGCGKSSLVDDVMSEELSRRLSSMALLDDAEEGNIARGLGRKVIIHVGDAVKKKFWPLLAEDRKKHPSCVCIADKNAPAPSWNIVADACSKSRGIPVPVLPDRAALETTSIAGVIKPDLKNDSSLEHYYPFSLSYLAVCMARVLERPPRTHQGKLDTGTEHACMLVIMFYSLYRNISAEDFAETLNGKFAYSGALEPLKNVELPFFADERAPHLPLDLRDTLTEALKFQYGYDLTKTKIKPKDKKVQAMEKRLRESIGKHRDLLLGLTVPRDESRNQFLDQIMDVVCKLESAALSEPQKPIKLVSIDVGKTKVHDILHQTRDSASKCFLSTAFPDPSNMKFEDGEFAGKDFVGQTHVTMTHCGSTPATEMRRQYGGIVGSSVKLKVKGLLWSDRVAALEVEVPEKTTGGVIVPSSTNKFTHITIWHTKKVKAVESNKLPDQIESGKAQKVEFEQLFTLSGTFIYWDMANRPFKDD